MPQTSQPTFGELVRHYRTTSGLSLELFAKKAHLPIEAIEAIERETRLLPSLEIIDRLSDVIDLRGQERKTFFAIGQGQVVTPPPAQVVSPVIVSSIYVFLIADIRGYTHFIQQHGDVLGAKLATQFATIAKTEVERWEGRVIEIRGDEALAVFGSARLALHAAVELQERFAEATLADATLPLGVGIGIDAGEAVPVEGGFRGAALNLAARLCSLAQAGETLASDGLVHLARHVEELMYMDRGDMQFKGFDTPTHVMQIAKTFSSRHIS